MEFAPIATGYYLEGLSVDVDALWFSDPVGGGIHRRSASGEIETWLADKRWIGGILLNEDGRVLSSGPGGIAWIDPATGASGMLLAAIDGEPINGVNEMMPDDKGGLTFGTIDLQAVERGETPQPGALYRLDENGGVTRLCEVLKFSNGIAISADGRRLYHNDSFVGTFAYDRAPDGSIGNPTMLLEKPDCDGIALDCEGKIWITGFRSSAITCLLPDGTIDRQIAVPAGAVTNLRFGGADGRDLYVTTVTADAGDALAKGVLPASPTSTLYRARTPVAGLPVRRTRFKLA